MIFPMRTEYKVNSYFNLVKGDGHVTKIINYAC